MGKKNLADFKALTFDCYGTLIDWEQGIWNAAKPLLANNRDRKVTREQLLYAFAKTETTQESLTPQMLYTDLLTVVHKNIANYLNLITNRKLDEQFGNSVSNWPSFPDSIYSLNLLKTKYFLVVLSNVDNLGFSYSASKLGVKFDAVYTAEEIGSYKPNAQNFLYMIRRLKDEHGILPEQILHTAQSLHHDILPATLQNLATAWIDRQKLSAGGKWGATLPVQNYPKINFLYFTMSELAIAITDQT